MAAKTALLFGKSLLFFTLWAAAIHFSAVQIVLKKQAATMAFRRSGFNCRSTARDWALEDGFAVTAPEFSLERFLALLTSLNGHHFTPVF